MTRAKGQSTFPDRVYEVVARIPAGKVTTYGAIAHALGEAGSARMVGWAINTPPQELNLPCHRVVNRVGFLSGGWHFGHPDIMRDALLDEDVHFVDEYQVDLKRHFWEPQAPSTSTDEMNDLDDIADDEDG